MHTCPICGQNCTCNGDIDDAYTYTRQWAEQHCECCHEGTGLDSDGLPLEEEELKGHGEFFEEVSP